MGGARAMTDEEAMAWYWDLPPRPATIGAQDWLLQWLLLRWRVDPAFCAMEGFRMVPMPYQTAMLLDLADSPAPVYAFHEVDDSKPKRKVLSPSGHGLGKTRTLAFASWWHMLTHRFSMRLITAPSADQITQRVFGEKRKLYRRLKQHWPDLAAPWEIKSSSVTHSNPDYGDWITTARTARAEQPESLQGAHALDVDDEFGDLASIFDDPPDAPGGQGGILVLVEEASGVHDEIRSVLKGALSEQGARFLGIGNATRADGWFAEDIQKTDRYAVHPLDCRLSSREGVYEAKLRSLQGEVQRIRIRGFVEPAYWEGLLAECQGDEDHDEFRVRVRGLPPRSSQRQVILAPWVDAAMARSFPDESKHALPVLGLDFGVTGDKHALYVRQGFGWRDYDEWLPKDEPVAITLDAVERAKRCVDTYGVRFIIGDANGVGRGAMETLHEFYSDRGEGAEAGVVVILYNSGQASNFPKTYYRMRSQMWHREGRQFVSDPRCSLPDDARLKRQLVTPTFIEKGRVIQVETKEAMATRTGEPSGNLSDAFLSTLLVDTSMPRRLGPPPPQKPLFPKVFQEHFDRLARRERAGHLIG